jgi:hypothetical protein
MENQKYKPKKWISFRVKTKEYDQIYSHFKNTTCRKLSEYARKVLLNKPVTVQLRNQTANDFLDEMVQLKNELNAIGNNFNQTVKRLHTLDKFPEIKTWLSANESTRNGLLKKSEEIRLKMIQIYELWSQK